MPSTPPPTSLRARTPPTPLHGPQYDNYEPYSPRRSKRSTAQSNPYSSFNTDKSPRGPQRGNITPPTTVKKAHFARQPTQLSSPPSSPSSPITHRSPRQLHKTPRKTFTTSTRRPTSGALSDSDHASSSLAPRSIDPVTMLPTPSKTPKKRPSAAVNSSSRILNFQPNNPNDVMPSPRKLKKHARHQSMDRFDLYDEDAERQGGKIEIYTDANARVPEMDGADDNPFMGNRKPTLRQQKRSRKAPTADDESMEEAAERDEGVIYVFRGKKIFRRFEDAGEANESQDGSHLGESIPQQSLKRKAGVSAQRPLTRSAIKPRLLFPSNEHRDQANDIDEEAVTDIEMTTATSPISKKQQDLGTPRVAKVKAVTPPPTNPPKKLPKRKAASMELTPAIDRDEPEPMSVEVDETFPVGYKRATRSPFDSWQRTKAGRKRVGEASEHVAGKKTRGAGMESPV